MTSPELRTGGSGLAIVRTIGELRGRTAVWRRAGESIGLVPTMGGLHAGHLALVRHARGQCERVVATSFLNPKQFDDAADLERYPRDEARDVAKFAAAGVDMLFAPGGEEIYPEGFATTVTVAGLTDCLCGAARSGHFNGVTTVVAKLLLQALPEVAYFGEKDYQQLLVVKRLVRDLDIPVRIVAVATVRDSDGLALSSRNQYLDPEQRNLAPALYRELTALAARLGDGRDAGTALARSREMLSQAGFDRVEYLELRDGETLDSLSRARPPARLFAAVWLGDTRLIDNLPVA